MDCIEKRKRAETGSSIYTRRRRDLLALLNLETSSTGSPNRNLPVPPETTNKAVPASRMFLLVPSINSACHGLGHGAWSYCGVTAARHECRLDCFRVDDLTHCSLLPSWPGLGATVTTCRYCLSPAFGVDSRTFSLKLMVSVISPPMDFQYKIPTSIPSHALPRQRIKKPPPPHRPGVSLQPHVYLI